jgi:hypothetical protein
VKWPNSYRLAQEPSHGREVRDTLILPAPLHAIRCPHQTTRMDF